MKWINCVGVNLSPAGSLWLAIQYTIKLNWYLIASTWENNFNQTATVI